MLLFQLTFFQLAFLRFGEWSWFTQMKTQPKFWLHACKLERAEPETKNTGKTRETQAHYDSQSQSAKGRGFNIEDSSYLGQSFVYIATRFRDTSEGFHEFDGSAVFFAKKSQRDFGRIAYIAHAIWSNGRFVAWYLAFFQDCWPKGNSIFITYTGTTFVSKIVHVGPSMSNGQ